MGPDLGRKPFQTSDQDVLHEIDLTSGFETFINVINRPCRLESTELNRVFHDMTDIFIDVNVS